MSHETQAHHSALRSLAGAAALAGMLAFASPGVEVARAEAHAGTGEALQEAIRTPLDASAVLPTNTDGAQSCAMPERDLPSSAQVADALLELQARAAAEGQDIVVFDGSGRNYATGRDPLAEIGQIRAELERQQPAE